MIDFQTDFCFRGSRDYVHSTTMLDCLGDLLLEHFDLSESDISLTTVTAKFHKLIRFNGEFSLSKDPLMDKSPDAEFVVSTPEQKLFASFNEVEDYPVKHRDDVEYEELGYKFNGNYSGEISYKVKDRLDYISCVVEANKKVHVQMHKEVEKLQVLNLVMQNFPLGLGAYPQEKLDILIKNLNVRQRDDSIATINEVSYPGRELKKWRIYYVLYGI